MKDQDARSAEQLTDKITLRRVSPDDREFLLRVYECSREIELSMVPWEAAMKRAFVEHQFDAQTSYYLSQYPDATHDIIVLADSGEGVGRLYVNRTDEQIAILDITILPEYRQRGIGSAIIDSLSDEGQKSGKAIQVYVETFNPSQEFFANRDFMIESNDGVNLKLVRYAKR